MGVKGNHTLKASAVHSRHDHRIAMAAAVAALRAEGPVMIEKRMPSINPIRFFDDLPSGCFGSCIR
jgi:3-phosphoshikimate 1-carboxyvinyltransferase